MLLSLSPGKVEKALLSGQQLRQITETSIWNWMAKSLQIARVEPMALHLVYVLM